MEGERFVQVVGLAAFLVAAVLLWLIWRPKLGTTETSGSAEKPLEKTPGLLGDVLSYRIVFDHFDIDFAELAKGLPSNLSRLVEVWAVYFAAWIFKGGVLKAQGEEFANQMLQKAKDRLAKADELNVGVQSSYVWTFDFWMEKLDAAGKFWFAEKKNFSIPAPDGSQIEAPIELIAAWTFLAFDPNSPYKASSPESFRNAKGVPDGALAEKLIWIRNQVQPWIASFTGAEIKGRWYLMAPPLLDPRTTDSGLFVNLKAPLSSWDILSGHETKAECERDQRARLSRAQANERDAGDDADALHRQADELKQQKSFDKEKFESYLRHAMAGMVRIQATQRVLCSKCVAADDPIIKHG